MGVSRGVISLALAALAVANIMIVLLSKFSESKEDFGSGALQLLQEKVVGQNSRTTALDDTTKVVWGALRPEHPQYYPNKIYLFTGQESTLYGHPRAQMAIRNILSRGNPRADVQSFNSLRVHALRAVAWDDSAHVIEYPDLHMICKTDLRGYVSKGNNVVFLGGFGSLDVINEIFGWQLDGVLQQDGPFYRSNRNVHNTVMATMPSLIPDGGADCPYCAKDTYGVRIKSLPAGARSYYDSLGDSVVWSVRYDLGMVTYLASSMTDPVGNGIWHKLLRAAVAL